MKDVVHRLVPRNTPRLLSLVIPIYNEEEVLPLLVERILGLLAQLPCAAEVIFVNDGSSDGSMEKLCEVGARDARFRAIALARNFGHQIAATAGLDAAQGDAVVLMDADLQDPPELVLDMLTEFEKGYDVVYAQRLERPGESWFKSCTAWLFYRLMRIAVDRRLPADVGDFRLISRRCLEALNSMREMHRFLRGMVSWVGFPQTSVTFVRPARAAGVSFSPAPLRLIVILGSLLFAGGSAYGAYVVTYWLLGGALVPGWTSLVVLVCLTGGAIMISIGILGEYVARIFEEIKHRPLYVVSERWNFEPEAPAGKERPAADSVVPKQ
jgi:dolichol-phosphate mannosyltransferase